MSKAGLSLLGLSALIALTSGAIAAPPPPPQTSAELAQPIDGYDLRPVYYRWWYWIERQKGPITEAAIEWPREMVGKRHFGRILRWKRSGELGHFATGDIRTYCEPSDTQRFQPDPSTCLFIVQIATVPIMGNAFREPNDLTNWMRSNFNAVEMAAHLRAIGLGPDTDWWRQDFDTLFANSPSPISVLTDNVEIVKLTSDECPSMGEAIKELEGQPIADGLDVTGVGEDAGLRAPRPHSTTNEYEFTFRADGFVYRLEGSRGPPARLASPILTAIGECLRGRD